MIDAADFIEPGFAGGRTWCPPLTEGQPAPQYMNIRFDRVYYTDSFCCSSSGTSTSSSGNSGSSSGGSSSGSGARQGRFRVRAVEYKLIGGEDIEWGPTDTEWRSYNTPSDHRGIVTVLRFETPHAYSDTGTVDTAGPFSGQHVTTVEDSDDEPEPPAHNAVAIGARAAGMGTVGAGLTGLGTAGTAAHIGGMVGGSTNTGPFSSSPYSSPPPSKRPRQNEAGSGAGAGDMRKLMRAAAEKRLG
ncbi:hypothetical protein B484DRAFT_445372 [Ochromonadaceae sp. CCMP2298]|nr:hypothetical protein B484DRAFT_445372 [Ochromonadaceae sp. CCMP2298]